MTDLRDFYESYAEDERLTSRRSRLLEYLTTMEYLRRYVGPGSSVADIGAGTGRYSFELAKTCARVAALDLVDAHVESMERRIDREGTKSIEAFAGSAVDLSRFPDGEFDAVLCLGPYYHLRNEEDRLRCLGECARIAKKGGILFVAYINRLTAMLYFVRNGKRMSADFMRSLEDGECDAIRGFDRFLDISHFSDPESVEAEARSRGLEVLRDVGVDGISYFIADELERMGESEWEDFVGMHLRHCEDRGSFGMSMHGLLVCRKPREGYGP